MRAPIMAKLQSLLVSALVCVSSLGCSSEDSGEAGGPFAPPGNGVAMAEAQACDTLRNAEIDAFLAKSCGPITRPPCPDYLRQGREACLQYDQGTIQGCAQYVSGLATCDELKAYECIWKELPGTAPSGCP